MTIPHVISVTILVFCILLVPGAYAASVEERLDQINRQPAIERTATLGKGSA